MNTPREKKQQQQLKKALSAKKGPVKGLRNVLSQPYSTPWPVLSNQKDCQLEVLLGRLLPGLKREERSVPWSQLRKMTRDERRAAKMKLCSDSEETETADKTRKLITFGVNAVTRLLEKNKLCSVLLDSTVEKMLIKHLIVMAQNNKVPILLVPFLKKVSLESLGFATVAMAFRKKMMATRSACDEIHQEIVKLAEAMEVPENIKLTEESPPTPNIEDVEMSSEENKAPETCVSVSTNVYKYRSKRNERIFVPPTAEKETLDTSENSGDFISIGKDDSNSFVPKSLVPRKNQRYMDIDVTEPENMKTKATYLPLKVKRIQGNNNRVKATKLSKSNKKSTLNKK